MKLKKQMGLTIVELIVCMAILAIVMASIAGVFTSVENTNIVGNDKYNSQSNAQLIMSKIQNEIKYADTFTIDSHKPSSFSSETLYIYCANGGILKNLGVVESNSSPLINLSQGYTYNLDFKESSSKSVEVTVTVSKNSKKLYSLKTNVFINNLLSSNISGVAEGSAIEYTISEEAMPVTSITVSSSNDSISTVNGNLQMSASVLPSNATDKSVIWSVGSNIASISSSGLLTAISNGIVTITATANDGSGVTGTSNISITNQPIKVTSISVSSAKTSISKNSTLQMNATVLPNNATDTSVTWSVSNSNASISPSGLLTGVNSGTVTVTATANDGSGISGTSGTITITKK